VTDTARVSKRRRFGLAALPLVAFLALGLLLLARLGAGDASKLPSALIGQQAPPLALAGLDGAPGLKDADLRAGHVTLVNIFASWCEPCHVEHEYLLGLAGDADLKAKGVEILGVAQKDSAENIRRFLNAAGDPYAKIGLDPDDRAGIDWGVYGVPETFVVRGDGVIAYKFVGPMDPDAIEKTLKPEILKAAQKG
jgi:cytochrome c biogenesis protein CcmG, thiol:disulfide interchange protein DsbE